MKKKLNHGGGVKRPSEEYLTQLISEVDKSIFRFDKFTFEERNELKDKAQAVRKRSWATIIKSRKKV